MKNQPKLLAVLVAAALLAGCAGGGGSGGSGPGGEAGRPPAQAQSEPSACGTVNGRPVQCIPTQRAAIDAAMSASSRGSMPSAETFEALGMFAPPGAPRSSSKSTPAPTPRPGYGADSTGLGFQYQSFGAWDSKNTQFSSGISASSGGQPTPAAAVPSSGNARFTGNLVGIHQSGSSGQTARANLVLDANFSSRSLGFASSNTTLNGSAAPRLDLNGTLTYAPGSSSFAGTLRSAGGTLSGSASGVFYGPRAEEAGGTFILKSSGTESLTGAYGAKR
jgi:C-lobe and N-lobe beta barrels of Tf-binding protein B